MCIRFGYNPQINFLHFFRSLNLVNIFGSTITKSFIDIGYLVNAKYSVKNSVDIHCFLHNM